MRNNDIQDEDYGKEIPEPKQPIEVPFFVVVVGGVIVACLLSILVALTIRFDRWLLH